MDSIAVDKDFLDMINKEYQHFAEMKTTQMKTIKEYSQKMLSQLDTMKMPQLGISKSMWSLFPWKMVIFN